MVHTDDELGSMSLQAEPHHGVAYFFVFAAFFVAGSFVEACTEVLTPSPAAHHHTQEPH